MKTCTKCSCEKDESGFYMRSNKKSIDSQCKECVKKRAVEWWDKNPDKRKISDRIYRSKNKVKLYAAARKWALNNPEKRKKICREWRRNNPGVERNYRYSSKYGISLEDYNQLYDQQNGLCLICGKGESRTLKGSITRLVVDHDHSNGKVRGLLCHACNYTLGIVGDDIKILLSMMNYLAINRN